MTQDQLAMMVEVGLRLLSLRALIVLGLVLDAGLFGWAMWAGGYDRLAIAGCFALSSWTLVHLRRET